MRRQFSGLLKVVGDSSRGLLGVLAASFRGLLGVLWASSRSLFSVLGATSQNLHGVRSWSQFSEFLGGAAKRSRNRFRLASKAEIRLGFEGAAPKPPATWLGRLIPATWLGRSIPIILCGAQHADSSHNSWDHIFILWYLLPLVICIAYHVC